MAYKNRTELLPEHQQLVDAELALGKDVVVAIYSSLLEIFSAQHGTLSKNARLTRIPTTAYRSGALIRWPTGSWGLGSSGFGWHFNVGQPLEVINFYPDLDE